MNKNEINFELDGIQYSIDELGYAMGGRICSHVSHLTGQLRVSANNAIVCWLERQRIKREQDRKTA